MCHPEAQAEGSLGTGVPWEDNKKSVLGMFYVHCQGVTSFSFTLNGVLLFNTP